MLIAVYVVLCVCQVAFLSAQLFFIVALTDFESGLCTAAEAAARLDHWMPTEALAQLVQPALLAWQRQWLPLAVALLPAAYNGYRYAKTRLRGEAVLSAPQTYKIEWLVKLAYYFFECCVFLYCLIYELVWRPTSPFDKTWIRG